MTDNKYLKNLSSIDDIIEDFLDGKINIGHINKILTLLLSTSELSASSFPDFISSICLPPTSLS